MTLFLGTLLIVLLCCLAMGLGMLVDGRSLAGGCGGKPPGAPECVDCPRRKKAPGSGQQGESGC
jgi:hypothetical protein